MIKELNRKWVLLGIAALVLGFMVINISLIHIVRIIGWRWDHKVVEGRFYFEKDARVSDCQD
ncbi:hypothetical protein NECAME_10082 [Necator americanus]|uniref:Uncharacterized protein n=1 Tax=Necator americanus TaxID=51031 RepID=W2TCY2_NECAM|nr:hypothetical protein NECAME_10082 [Necator americanus]ETN78857.1 hypothetical protein NECAME_10082 [Necator americanus]